MMHFFLVWVVINENVGNFLDDLGIKRQEWTRFPYFNNSRRSVKSIITLLKMNFLTKLNAWCRQIRKSIGNTKFVHLNWKFLWNFLVPKETRMIFLLLRVDIFFLSTYYGITGCGVFKAGIQNWKGVCIKINCSQMKLLNFENWTNRKPQ